MNEEITEAGLEFVSIEDELKQSYLDYAMSVIVGRALPDVRDGLKPVHRRVLFAMHKLNNDWDKSYKKSARIVGDVIGKYHPHGDKAAYDTIVRMAQEFAMRYRLVDGQGNFGSVDGDMPAAMRYTEVRLTKISHTFLSDLDKDTVDFVPNYDGSEKMPSVLPARVPNLLINGTAGIAVGMATSIPTHNIGEVIDGCLAILENPDIQTEDLMRHIPAPDFPTGGFIYRSREIVRGYATGRGQVRMRARHELEENREGREGRTRIVVTEIPYRVNKADLLTKIAELVRDKKIEGIVDLRDESNKDGMRIVIDLSRTAISRLTINLLYKHTALESSFPINMVCLVNGKPRTLTLKGILQEFISHRREVVIRRTLYLLRQAKHRGHILEGLTLALANVDKVIALIKQSQNAAEAKQALLDRIWDMRDLADILEKAKAGDCRPDTLGPEYGIQKEEKKTLYKMSPQQAQAILDLRLQRLTSMERRKLYDEYGETIKRIGQFSDILKNPDKLRALIREELEEMKEQFGDKRRSEIIVERGDPDALDLIKSEQLAILLSRNGYIKAQPLSEFKQQKRGGQGITATGIKDEDAIEKLVNADSHDWLLCFSNTGRVYRIPVHEIPQLGRLARGKPIANLLPLGADEKIITLFPQGRDIAANEDRFILLATESGRVKRLRATHFVSVRPSGLLAIKLLDNDRVVGALSVKGKSNILLISSGGLGVRCNIESFRPQGRAAGGVRGMRLNKEHKLISMLPADDAKYLITVSVTGYAKRTRIEDFSIRGRGGKGMIAMRMNERNTELAGACVANDDDELMLIVNNGKLIRLAAKGISIQSRTASGVRTVRVAGEGFVKSLTCLSGVGSDRDESHKPDEK